MPMAKQLSHGSIQKSVNLQYNTLGRLDDWTKKPSSKRLMFQLLFFFHDFLQNSLQKFFQFIFLFFYKISTKIKIKSFESPKSIKSIKKDNPWNIRLLVDDLFVPSSKQPSVIYCRLTDFKIQSQSFERRCYCMLQGLRTCFVFLSLYDTIITESDIMLDDSNIFGFR
jgi:hypothetical protein